MFVSVQREPENVDSEFVRLTKNMAYEIFQDSLNKAIYRHF